MGKQTLELTNTEAAVALSTLVAFADGEPSEEEGRIMREYYRFGTVEEVQRKFDEGGYDFPSDLPDAETYFLPVLKGTDEGFRLRTLAVAFKLAHADGHFDKDELRMLRRYAAELGVELDAARVYAESSLKEVDENEDYSPAAPVPKAVDLPMLLPQEAGIALASLVAVSDDEPTDLELGVLREHYSYEEVESMIGKMTAAGLEYPRELPLVKPSIAAALAACDRTTGVRYMAIAYKVAGIDGEFDPAELATLKEFQEEFMVGTAELGDFFKANPEI